MNAEQTAAFRAFLATLSPTQRYHVMNMTSSRMADLDESMEINEQQVDEVDGYDLISAIDATLIDAVANGNV